MTSLDLTLLSLYRIKGQEQPILPGLLAQTPPRRTARGRENDRLLVYLNLAGNVPFSNEEYAQVTARLAERFYQTSGSLTFALKSSVEALNTVLAERNMKTTGQGKYTIGVLVLAALRGNLLYIVQAGPTRVYWLGLGGLKHFYDPSLAGKGLGLSQNSRMYFAQAQLNPGDLLVISANQPKEWQAALEEHGPVTLDSLRRRLATVTTDSLNAVLLSAEEGAGEIRVIRPPDVPKSEPTAPAPRPISPPPQEAEALEPLPDVLPAATPPLNQEAPRPEPIPPSTPTRQTITPPRRAERGPLVSPEKRTQMVHVGRRSARWMAQAIHALRDLSHAFNERVGKFIPRLLPGDEEETERQISTPWLAFMAIAIPILVVVVAATIYFEIGRPAQYDIHYTYAVEAAMQTQSLTDPAELRVKWQATLFHLDQADQYRVTTNSERLRREAQAALDSLDRVRRVTYRPAFASPLANGARIVRLAASDFDLYLLSAEGSVLRATMSGNYYNLQNFDCQPGTYNGITVGPLIDILALPRTSPNGVTLMGMDSMGNLLYCIPGQAPRASFLTLPSTERKGIDAFAYDAGILYVLDSRANAVWTYNGQPGGEFSEPFFFFQQQIPRLATAIGLAVNGDDLYILHSDGHLTTCTFSRISTSPTRCTDPAQLTDTRPGYRSGTTIADGIFTQIFFTPAPDPSVALLEPNTRAIFRFSPRALELQHQIRGLPGKEDPLPEASPMTAMTFSPNKVLFVLAGGQVFYAVSTP
jgi:hypothetical protein